MEWLVKYDECFNSVFQHHGRKIWTAPTPRDFNVGSSRCLGLGAQVGLVGRAPTRRSKKHNNRPALGEARFRNPHIHRNTGRHSWACPRPCGARNAGR